MVVRLRQEQRRPENLVRRQYVENCVRQSISDDDDEAERDGQCLVIN